MPKLKRRWKIVKFGDVARLSKTRSADPLAQGIERYVGLEHIEPGDLRIRSWGNVTDGTTFTSRFRPGQVLFGKRRAYQRKVAVADFDGVCSGDIYVLESADPSRLLPELLPFICQTDGFFEHAVGTSAGSLSPRTNWTNLAIYEFALPPLEEQQRLVSALTAFVEFETKLGVAFDAARVAIDRVALDLLLPAGTTFFADTKLHGVPEGWESLRIRDLCTSNSDLVIGPFGSNLLSSDYLGRTVGTPVVFVRDIRPNRFEYRSDCFVSPEKTAELRAHMARPGDLLVTKVGVPEFMGTPPGLSAVLPVDFQDSIITADVVRARLDRSKVVPEYIARLLNTAWGRQQTWRISPGSTTRFKMTLGNFSNIRLPVPPIEYQRDTVDHLARLSSGAEALRTRLAEARATKQIILDTVGK
jgi:type I restriction enzyme S subunit